ncbi:nuclear receptor coactivator 3 isoform X5 [Dendroctonus ponderosae]|uniref:nuclear receptor coactivator 3 isoform X5 n=1 Tax=Dendroctonus ponderosae TaxID=77166 RepID=UPI002034FA8B|nr:nuclear receptor coactivator 3 isoform X5 [Dendroctonus ponderosae]
MLEHSAMYLNATPPYEEDTFFSEFYTRVGPCELQEPVWAKMNALTGIKQKRKKSENKPQTQINKCNNEKRRREQENIYIEELAELISANFADMSSLSVKPDKCAILQETVNQIRRIKQQDSANQQNADPVQQGEVSSSRPTILSNEIYGPLLLEALEGFLFVINSEGRVEHVTENVDTYLRYTKEDLIGKSIYNFMHLGDHTKFHSNLLPMTIEWGNELQAPTRSKSIDVRLLIKPDDLDETLEQKSQREACYELMHISSTLLRDQLSVSEDDGSDNGPCLLCVASRISQREKGACYFEQFTTKLDTSGKIICVDTSGVSEPISQLLRKDFKGRVLRDFVPAQDVHKITAHIKETLNSGSSISSVYRIQVAPDKLVTVQTKSKFFKTNPHSSCDTDFIMATHSIISDNDTLDPGGGIGGPLMNSIVNGVGTPTRNGPPSIGDSGPPSSSASTASLIQTASSGTNFPTEFLDNDFPSLDFPTTTWDLEPPWPETARPNSRQSLTPVSTPTPRPPSNPSYSNAPTVVQSPMTHYTTMASPGQPITANQGQQSQPSNYMLLGLMEDFSEQPVYPVDEQKDTKALDEPSNHPGPQRLRVLLTNPPTANANSSHMNDQQDGNRDRILKELLNQQDDDHGVRMDSRSNARLMSNRGQMVEPPKNSSSSSTGNNMLRQLLNDKNDDVDVVGRAGMKKSELLQQLLKKDSDDDDDKKNENIKHEDKLLQNLGFPTSSTGSEQRRAPKRPSDEKDEREHKRNSNGAQVSSTGSSEKSEIYQKNKMLASLLENPTPTPPSIPPIPASVISATPQEKLPRVISDPAKLIGGTMAQTNYRHNNAGRMNARQQPNYLNNNNFQRPVSGMYNQTQATPENQWGENNNFHGVADPDLSDILDTVLDFVPDSGLLMDGAVETQQSKEYEVAAIKNIQDILMQCEQSVPSPNVSLPARPPSYNANVSTQNNLNYPPPPNYPQVKYQRPMGVRSGAPPHYSNANYNAQTQMQLEQQQQQQLKRRQQIEEHKHRLLQQQKQQQLLIPSNATSAEINSMQNIDNLLNTAVAPNVTLQRSNSVPEAQLSPGYSNQMQGGNTLSQTNQRGVNQGNQQQQQPYSPHAQMPSPLGQQNFQAQNNVASNYNQQQQRGSPQAQFNAQLSPRQNYPQQGNGAAAAPNWNTQQRLTVQNPMLNAQLTGALTGRGNFQRPPGQQAQPQRTLSSPVGVPGVARQSYGGDQFNQPTSPTTAFNQTQFLQRLQRANSVPTTSSPMTGQYPGNKHYPPNPLQSIPQNPLMYAQPPTQQDSYNCYEAQQQQSNLAGYERRASAPSAQHMQSGVAGSNPTSEFVRQELRAVVGARTAQSQPTGQRPGPSAAQQLQQQLGQQGVDLESLGLTFEMPTGASDSPKLWGAMGSEMGSMSPQPATSRTTMDEGRPGDHSKTSLLQQLLSDQSK